MRVRVSTHAAQRARERFPSLAEVEDRIVYSVVAGVGHQGIPIASMFPKEQYRVGCLRCGTPMIVAMKPAYDATRKQECLLVTTVLTDNLVVPHAMLGHTAKAVHEAKRQWRIRYQGIHADTPATPGPAAPIASR